MDKPQTATLLLDQVIADRYRLEGILGRGGMGAVYSAVHQVTQKRVAVKVLHQWSKEDPVIGRRFLREAQAAAAIGHTAIPEVLDAGEDDGYLYLVFELLDGQDLEQRVASDEPLTGLQFVQIVTEILDALEAAHAQNFVHRDIKPSNVFLHRTEAGTIHTKLLDFGASKRCDSAQRVTRPGAVIGTLHYMSPEQALGREIDARADLWAVGAMLFRAFVGSPPFQADTHWALLHEIARGRARTASSGPHPIPADLSAVIDRALHPDVDARWPDAYSMRKALEACAREPLAAIRVFRPEPDPRPQAQVSTYDVTSTRPPALPSGAPRTGLAKRSTSLGAAWLLVFLAAVPAGWWAMRTFAQPTALTVESLAVEPRFPPDEVPLRAVSPPTNAANVAKRPTPPEEVHRLGGTLEPGRDEPPVRLHKARKKRLRRRTRKGRRRAPREQSGEHPGILHQRI